MTDCAWCLQDRGITPVDGSHGICTDHSTVMRAEHRWNKLQAVPSYVESNSAKFAAESLEETIFWEGEQ